MFDYLIETVPACSSGTLTNGLPHRNVQQTQDTTPHPVTVYRHGADLSLYHPLMWKVTLEYTATHFNVLGKIRSGNPSPNFHTPANAQLYTGMVVVSRKLGRKYRTNRVLNPGHVVCESIKLSTRPQLLPLINLMRAWVRLCVRAWVRVCARVCACVNVCVRACVREYVCVCAWVRARACVRAC